MSTVPFTFGTLCSGIEAASEAFLPLGAECLYVSEVEPYPCGVLADRHGAGKPMRMPPPDEAKDDQQRRDRINAIKAVERFDRWGDKIPNYGDLTQIDPEELPAVDLLVAGFPCQDYSIAGLRASLAGARGNLTLYGVKLIHELVRLRRLRAALLEQVPDILNTKDNAFGALLGGLVGHDAAIASPLKGGRWTNAGVAHGPSGTAVWRVLDAQYAGVAQRRERLFVVGSFGDGPDPVEVLLERQGLSRNPPARRKAGEGIAGTAPARAHGGSEPGGWSEDRRPGAQGGVPFGCDYDHEVGRPLVAAAAGNRSDLETETVVVGTLTANGKAAGSATQQDAEQGLLIPVVAQEVSGTLAGGGRASGGYSHDDLPLVAHTLRAKHNAAHRADVDTLVPTAFNAREDLVCTGDVIGALGASSPQAQAIAFSSKDYGGDAGELSPTLRAMGHGSSHPNAGGQVAIAIPINADAARLGVAATPSVDATGKVRRRDPGLGIGDDGDPMFTMQTGTPHALAFSLRGREGGAMPEVEEGGVSPGLRAADGGSTRPFVACATGDVTPTLTAGGHDASEDGTGRGPPLAADGMAVRRITVVEGCRLQGFADFHTLIEWPTANRKGDELAEQIAYLVGHGFTPERAAVLAQTPDGPQYKSIGNSKCVPLVRKLGERFAAALARHDAERR